MQKNFQFFLSEQTLVNATRAHNYEHSETQTTPQTLLDSIEEQSKLAGKDLYLVFYIPSKTFIFTTKHNLENAAYIGKQYKD